PDEPDTPRGSRRIVIVPANLVPQPRWLRSLLDAELSPEAIYVDPALTAVIVTADPARVLAGAARCRSAGELLGERRGASVDLPAGVPEVPARRGAPLPGPLDPRRRRRRAGATQAHRVAPRGDPRLLGRQPRPRRRVRVHRRRLDTFHRGGVAARPRGRDDRKRARIGGVRLPSDVARRRVGRRGLHDGSPHRGLLLP